MAKKQDIRVALTKWEDYASLTGDAAATKIHDHAKATSEQARDWYWKSIGKKRRASLIVRGLSYGLLVAGAALPVTAGLSSDPVLRLTLTQLGVTALAVAGLLQAGDRIFGWSSGWLRYISTATAMENATRRFELDWSGYILTNGGAVEDDDKKALFDLARKLEEEIAKLQTDETEKWVAEFNSGLALLSDLIKSQRESAEKAAEAAHAAVAADAKAKQPGAIELTLVHKADPVPVKVQVDGGAESTFAGTAWSWLGMSPGLHEVSVTVVGSSAQVVKRVVEVPGGGVVRVEVKLP